MVGLAAFPVLIEGVQRPREFLWRTKSKEFAFWSRVEGRGSRVTSRGSRVNGRGSKNSSQLFLIVKSKFRVYLSFRFLFYFALTPSGIICFFSLFQALVSWNMLTFITIDTDRLNTTPLYGAILPLYAIIKKYALINVVSF